MGGHEVAGLFNCAEKGASRGRRLLGGDLQVDLQMTKLLGGWRGRCGGGRRPRSPSAAGGAVGRGGPGLGGGRSWRARPLFRVSSASSSSLFGAVAAAAPLPAGGCRCRCHRRRL